MESFTVGAEICLCEDLVKRYIWHVNYSSMFRLIGMPYNGLAFSEIHYKIPYHLPIFASIYDTLGRDKR